MNSRTARLGWVILAFAVLGAVPALLLAGAKKPWTREALPPSIRERVHFAAVQVPAFPMGGPRLDKPENWPESMTIGGIRCVRRIHAWDDDDAVALASLKDAEPEHRLMLFYAHAGSGWNSATAGWGPRYTWNAQKKLIERLWYEPDSTRLVTHDYTYYRSGRLLGYSVRKEPRKHSRVSAKPYEFLSQFFDKNGKLIAIAYEKMSAGSRDSVYAWMGAVVPYDQFRMKTHILYSSAHPGER